MRYLDVIKRLFLIPWAFLRASKLPRCPRCNELMDAHNQHHAWQCERRCETCKNVECTYAGPEFALFCTEHRRWVAYSSWCRDWAPRKETR